MSDQPGELTGRRILLTGATGSIGRATARILAESGAKLVLNGRDRVKLEQVAAILPADSFIIAPFDLNNGDGIARWMQELSEKGGAFSGVVHAAGIQVLKALRTTDSEFIANNFRANTASALMLAKGFRQKMCHTEDQASLVLVSSTAATIGGGGNIAYSSSKAGLTHVTKAIAQELMRDKIRANCVVSGLIDSDMSQRAQKVTPAESWQVAVSGYPMGIGKPEDIAYAIIYLLSPRSKWLTGTDLLVDGGLNFV